jgi:hypothetical protein
MKQLTKDQIIGSSPETDRGVRVKQFCRKEGSRRRVTVSGGASAAGRMSAMYGD